jgi:hypothetical protein
MIWVGQAARTVVIEMHKKLWLDKYEGKRNNIQINFNKNVAGVYRIQLLKLTVETSCKHDTYTNPRIPQRLPCSQTYSTSESLLHTHRLPIYTHHVIVYSLRISM